MKIGLIFPNKDRRYKTIHLGLAYLAAYARTQHTNLSFEVLDTRVATRGETRRFFNQSFDLVGMTVFSPVYFEVKALFKRVKSSHPETPVVLGGPYVTTIMEEIFEETPAEYAVYGEGEITFSALIAHLKGSGSAGDIDGLMYRDESGAIVVNPPREKFRDLTALPMPAYDIFPMQRYPLHRLVTGRGCPYACAWCNSSSIWDRHYHWMSAEKILEEIRFLINTYGKKIVVFGDNCFNANLKRVEELCDLLIRENIQILWSASIRADNMTQEVAHKMKKAGCYNVAIGIESANNDILEKIGKQATIEKMTEGIRMLKNAGIEIMSQYVIGSPYETLENVRESIAFARKSGCDYTNFYSILPYKGTVQWDYIERHGTFLSRKIHDYHQMNPRVVFETPEFTYRERLEAIRLVRKEGFYSNKDKKTWWFDFAKETGRKIQQLLPAGIGERLYLILKSIYQIKIVKKNNL
ncbi:MAG: radical SAM protein [Bacteroidales bacterium]